jgi:hypothetical protein
VLVDTEWDRIPQRQITGARVGPGDRLRVLERVATDQHDRGKRTVCRIARHAHLSDPKAGGELLGPRIEFADRRTSRHPDAEQLARRHPGDPEHPRDAERTGCCSGIKDGALPSPPQMRVAKDARDPAADRS